MPWCTKEKIEHEKGARLISHKDIFLGYNSMEHHPCLEFNEDMAYLDSNDELKNELNEKQSKSLE